MMLTNNKEHDCRHFSVFSFVSIAFYMNGGIQNGNRSAHRRWLKVSQGQKVGGGINLKTHKSIPKS